MLLRQSVETIQFNTLLYSLLIQKSEIWEKYAEYHFFVLHINPNFVGVAPPFNPLISTVNTQVVHTPTNGISVTVPGVSGIDPTYHKNPPKFGRHNRNESCDEIMALFDLHKLSSNAHAQPSSGARCLIFGWTLRPLSYFMCVNSEGSGETALICRLACAFPGRLCDKYHNLMSWLKCCYYPTIEPCHEKTYLWGFCQGKTQTGLLSWGD